MSFKNKLKSLGFFEYGKEVDGFDYPVLNEGAIRAGAGIMFVIAFFSFMQAFYLREFVFIKFVVVAFLIDFFIKVLINPKFSPVSILASWIVRKQKPEYVGAIQKRFAWSIGLAMALSMTILVHGFGIMNYVTLGFCLVCMIFMFMETSFGICVGCKIYYGLISVGLIDEPKVRPVCPGGACPMPVKKKK